MPDDGNLVCPGGRWQGERRTNVHDGHDIAPKIDDTDNMRRGCRYGKDFLGNEDLGKNVDRHGVGVPADAEEAYPHFLLCGRMRYHLGGDVSVHIGQTEPLRNIG